MFTETRKALALAALVAIGGVTAIELARGTAYADPSLVAGGAAGYAGGRVDAAFTMVATAPAAAPVIVAAAEKGDMLPIGCAGPFEPDVAAECIDTAYEIESEGPAFIIETRTGDASSALTRIAGFTVAGF